MSLDEWNVWYLKRFVGDQNLEIAEAPHLIEDTYNVADAVVVGNLLISMLRHADRVRIGCLAQLVNVIAPIRTEAGGPVWRQTTFHPFALTSKHGRGSVLRAEVDSPVMETKWFGDAPVLDAAATLDDSGSVTVFAVNRDQDQPMTVSVNVRALPELARAQHTVLHDDDPDAVNTAEAPDRVVPCRLDDLSILDGRLDVVLPPVSWSMIRLVPA